MGFAKEEKSKKVLRGVKTVFFLISMLISFLLFSAPILLVIADTLLLSLSSLPLSLLLLYHQRHSLLTSITMIFVTPSLTYPSYPL
ncbi:hypothetical protein NC651_025929 [Populus alba x Populus x berolinensis]|nr:hypothetical protein NC651_025929 [Populus alba x Populus x berolinensis]